MQLPFFGLKLEDLYGASWHLHLYFFVFLFLSELLHVFDIQHALTFFVPCFSGSTSGAFKGGHDVVAEKDLEHLLYLLDGKAGVAVWQNQMERTTPNMIYQAWRHEPEVKYGIFTL